MISHESMRSAGRVVVILLSMCGLLYGGYVWFMREFWLDVNQSASSSASYMISRLVDLSLNIYPYPRYHIHQIDIPNHAYCVDQPSLSWKSGQCSPAKPTKMEESECYNGKESRCIWMEIPADAATDKMFMTNLKDILLNPCQKAALVTDFIQHQASEADRKEDGLNWKLETNSLGCDQSGTSFSLLAEVRYRKDGKIYALGFHSLREVK